MPWSSQSGNGSGWKGGGGGGGGPWGGGGGGGQQPDLEEFLRRGQDRIKQAIPGGGPPGALVALIGLVAVALVGFFAFTFRVDQDEVGVVLRFGKFDRQEPPGLHFRLPSPIEEVRTPKVTRQNLTEIGFRSGGATRGSPGGGRDVPEESVMLTGDQNIVDVDFVIYWRIKDANLYLFNIQNPDSTVKEVAESVMREVIGKSDIQPILTEARQSISQAVQKMMQSILDTYKAGITIDEVRLLKVAPPAPVAEAFLDVQAARADQDRLKSEAEAYKNRVVPEAEGQAKRIEKEAEAFRDKTIAEAVGETSRFLKVYDEYKKSPDVTRRRIYLETIERILAGSDKIILDSRGGPAPILPLDMLRRKGN